MNEIKLPKQVGELSLMTYPAYWEGKQFPLVRSEDYGRPDFLHIILANQSIFSHGGIITSPIIERRRKDGFEEPKIMQLDSTDVIVYPLNYDQVLQANFLLILFPQAILSNELIELGLTDDHLRSEMNLVSPAPPQTNLLRGEVEIADNSFYNNLYGKNL